MILRFQYLSPQARLLKSTDDRPFYEAPTYIDVALYADALVAIYRFLPEEEVEHIFLTCLEPERSPAVKMCVIKACIMLVIEVQLFFCIFTQR